MIVLGAPDGSADADHPDHLVDERRLISEAVKLGVPVLGVCFGAQLLAVALDGSVVKDGPLEVGMGRASLTDAGVVDPVLGTDSKDLAVVHWHRDAYTLPPGAVRLASGERHTEQAFRFGKTAYGLQFHVEINAQLAGTIADQMPAGSLPPDVVCEAAAWGDGVLDRFLALG